MANKTTTISSILSCLIAQLFGTITPSLAQESKPDPTFSGLVNMLHCNLRTSTVCSGDYCADLSGLPGGGGNLWISLTDLKLSSTSAMGDPRYPPMSPYSAPAYPIRIVEVSQAAFNAMLYVKFTYSVAPADSSITGLLVLLPRTNGGYEIHFGGTGSNLNQKIGSLTFNRTTTGGTCEIVNRP